MEDRFAAIPDNSFVMNHLYGDGALDEIVAKHPSHGTSVQRRNLQTLQPGTWLSDEIINYFFILLRDRDRQLQKRSLRSCRGNVFSNSFFFSKLLGKEGYNYNNVRNWSKRLCKDTIFELDKVIIPCNVNGVHWTCVVAYMQEHRIQYYDSMGDDGNVYTDALLRFIEDEWKSKKGEDFFYSSKWKIVGSVQGIPRQRNTYDCGVYTCLFADFLSANIPLNFQQENVDRF